MRRLLVVALFSLVVAPPAPAAEDEPPEPFVRSVVVGIGNRVSGRIEGASRVPAGEPVLLRVVLEGPDEGARASRPRDGAVPGVPVLRTEAGGARVGRHADR